MLRFFVPLALQRGGRMVMLAGLAVFATSLAFLSAVSPDWAAMVHAVPATALTVIAAALLAQMAMSLTHAVATRNLRRDNEQMHTAIDSMAQGLCMFDA